MKILYLPTNRPGDYSFGGTQRDNHMSDVLRSLGTVDTIVVGQGDQAVLRDQWDEDRVMEIVTRYDAGSPEKSELARKARRAIGAALRETRYDFIVARYFRTAFLVPFRFHDRLVVDADDFAINTRRSSLASIVKGKLRFMAVRAIARRAFHIWLVDPRDETAIRPKRSSILPNTARAIPSRRATSKSGPRLLMVGLYGHVPNEDGLRWFADRIMPTIRSALPQAELHAVGRYYDPSLEALGPGFVMRGFVDDIAQEYADADVVICPIRSGSGTQIKVVEGLMSGTPVVSSEFSYLGFSDVLRRDEHLLVASSEKDWADHVLSVLREPERFRVMADAGKAMAEEVYSLPAFERRIRSTLISAA